MQTGLKDRIAIITGSSNGMGRASAAALACEGVKVAMCARTEKTLLAAADEIKGRHNVEVFTQAMDVTDSEAVRKFVAAVAQRFGGVDICVANAGGPPAKNFLSITAEEWQKAIATNFLSAVHLAREVIPYMQRKRWGRFLTITSTSVRQAIPDLVLSTVVRPAVVGLVKSLAAEFGKDGITANNIAPGYTETERLSELSKVRALAAGITEEEIKNRWAAEVPLRRLGKPEEIADAIVWLASERASYITGQTILVDGGIYKGM